MSDGNGVEEQVEAVHGCGHRLGIRGNQHLVGAQLPRVLPLLGRGRDHHHMGAHGVGELHPHMAEAPKTDDADLLARPDLPVFEGRVGGDARTQQRRSGGRIEMVGNAQHEALSNRDLVGVSTQRELVWRAAHLVFAIVGRRPAVVAILFQPIVARDAMTAAVHEAADAHEVSDLVFRYANSDSGYPSDDFMSRDEGILRAAPFVARGMNVRMADAAIEDVDDDIFGPGFAPFEAERGEVAIGRMGCVAESFHRN